LDGDKATSECVLFLPITASSCSPEAAAEEEDRNEHSSSNFFFHGNKNSFGNLFNDIHVLINFKICCKSLRSTNGFVVEVEEIVNRFDKSYGGGR
jgi:hypothetical protein